MEKWQEKHAEAKRLLDEVAKISANAEASAEDKQKAATMLEDVKRLKKEAEQLREIKALGEDLAKTQADDKKQTDDRPAEFKSLGGFLHAVAQAGNIKYRGPLHKGLEKRAFNDPEEAAAGDNGWEHSLDGSKDLGESTGAGGGFLVPIEQRTELMAVPAPVDNIRAEATVVPMRRRTLTVPALDQSGATAGAPHFFGGIESNWTEEAGEKPQHDPVFREIVLTAWKLVCYTRASDELLVDEAVGLAAFFGGPMGFAGAIKWQEEYAFLRGTGAGQPQGVIGAPGTLTHAREVQFGLTVDDVVSMLALAYGDGLTWHMSRSQMPNLLQLNGPSGNPSYIFIPNGRDGAPATLFGFPIRWSDKLPANGTTGDVLLANWRHYLVGDRQATTIESTNVERFRYDQTSWRAVHRVDGRPWLKAPLTFADGVTQVSPFVVLAAKST